MKKSSLWATIIIFVGLIVAVLGVNLGLSNTPVLGLDLKGGLSVIYATKEPADEEQLVIVRDLMRGQLENFGIAEPDVRVEGENIIVDLPGVSDQSSAFEALQVSGIVTLRPVIQCQAGVVGTDGTAPDSTTPGSTTPDSTTPDNTPDTTPTVTTDPGSVEESSAGVSGFAPVGLRSPAAAPDTTVPAIPDSSVPDSNVPASSVPASSVPASSVPASSVPDSNVPAPSVPVDAPTPVDTTGQEILPYPGAGQSCLLGPTVPGGTGEVFAQGTADASIDPQTGQWVANVDLRPEGQIVWDGLAQLCFSG
ncbi:MAG: hypothetical protein WKF60_08840, partial [Ilumatobacter sp.]